MSCSGEAASIQVAVRIRGLNPKEIAEESHHSGTITTDGERTVEIADPGNCGGKNGFEFNKVFWSVANEPAAGSPPMATQEDVYKHIGPQLLDHALSGRNVCVFAYGQTSSGKTYTMLGNATEAERGLIPRLCSELFCRIERASGGAAAKFHVDATFTEIYCEEVRDLLHGPTHHRSAAPRELKIRQHPEHGFFVEGLSSIPVADAKSVMQLLDSGMGVRATAETRLNEHSSRSHAIFQLHLRCEYLEEATDGSVMTHKKSSKISLVDLAGSEKVKDSGAVGERFKEASNINTSLSVLGRIIRELADADPSKPRAKPAYRESTLTQLLSDSIGGNSITFMVATVSPSRHAYPTSLNTLRFAGQAQRIVNVVRVNEAMETAKAVADLRRHNAQLTLELEAARAAAATKGGGDGGAAELKREAAMLSEKVRSYQVRCRLLETKLGDQGGDAAERARKSQAEATQLERDLARLRVEHHAAIRALRSELQEKDAELEGVRAEARRGREEVRVLRAKVRMDEDGGGFTADKAAKAEIRIAALRAQCEQLAKKNDALALANEDLRSQLHDAEDRAADAEAARDTAAARADAQRKEGTLGEAQRAALIEDVQRLRGLVCELQMGEQSLRAELEAAQHRQARLRASSQSCTTERPQPDASAAASASATSSADDGDGYGDDGVDVVATAAAAVGAAAAQDHLQIAPLAAATQAQLRSLRQANVQLRRELLAHREQIDTARANAVVMRRDLDATVGLLLEETEASDRALLHASCHRGYMRIALQLAAAERAAAAAAVASAARFVGPLVETLEDEAASRQEAMDNLYTGALELTRALVTDAQAATQRAQGGEAAACAHVESLQALVARLEAEIDDERRESTARASLLEQDVAARAAELHEAQRRIATAEEATAALQRRVASQECEVEVLRAEHLSRCVALQEAAAAADRRQCAALAELHDARTQYREALDAVEGKYAALLREAAAASSDDARRSVDNQQRLEMQIETLRASVARLSASCADAEMRESQLRDQMGFLERTAEIQEQELALAQSQARAELDALNALLNEERDEAEALRQRLERDADAKSGAVDATVMTSPIGHSIPARASAAAGASTPPPQRGGALAPADPNGAPCPTPLRCCAPRSPSAHCTPDRPPLPTQSGIGASSSGLRHVSGGIWAALSPAAHEQLLLQVISSANRLADAERAKREMGEQRRRVRNLDAELHSFSSRRLEALLAANEQLDEVERGL